MRVYRVYTANADAGEVMEKLDREALRIAGGLTRTCGIGGWRAPDGNIVVEPVMVWELVVPDTKDNEVRAFARLVAETCNQQEVLLTGGNLDVVVSVMGVNRGPGSLEPRSPVVVGPATPEVPGSFLEGSRPCPSACKGHHVTPPSRHYAAVVSIPVSVHARTYEGAEDRAIEVAAMQVGAALDAMAEVATVDHVQAAPEECSGDDCPAGSDV